jgi:hypothetical protein
VYFLSIARKDQFKAKLYVEVSLCSMNCVDSFLFVLLILVELVTVTIYTFRIEYIMVRTVIAKISGRHHDLVDPFEIYE